MVSLSSNFIKRNSVLSQEELIRPLKTPVAEDAARSAHLPVPYSPICLRLLRTVCSVTVLLIHHPRGLHERYRIYFLIDILCSIKDVFLTRLALLLTFCNGHNNKRPGSEDKLSVTHKAVHENEALKEGRMKFNEPGKGLGEREREGVSSFSPCPHE